MLPSRGMGKTAMELTYALNEAGFQVGRRQIERDLVELRDAFPIECNDDSAPYLWKWIDGAVGAVPGLTLGEALSLKLIEMSMDAILPPSITSVMKGRFGQATKKLNSIEGTNANRWAEKFRVVLPSLPRIPPMLDADLLERIQEAVLQGRKIQIEYESKSQQQLLCMHLNPLGIVCRGNNLYLVACEDAQFPRLFALHRFRHVEKLLAECNEPDDFSLAQYIESGGMHFGSTNIIRLEAEIEAWLAGDLLESPLGADQYIDCVDDQYRLSVSVADTWQLEWWILSCWAAIKVTGPDELRARVARKLDAAAKQYR